MCSLVQTQGGATWFLYAHICTLALTHFCVNIHTKTMVNARTISISCTQQQRVKTLGQVTCFLQVSKQSTRIAAVASSSNRRNCTDVAELKTIQVSSKFNWNPLSPKHAEDTSAKLADADSGSSSSSSSSKKKKKIKKARKASDVPKACTLALPHVHQALLR